MPMPTLDRSWKMRHLAYLILALAGMLVIYLITDDFGPGVSTDAVEYLSAAENLAGGTGFTNYKGEPYVYWAPLYPVLLALPRFLLNIDPYVSGWVLNVLAFGAILFVGAIWLGSFFPDSLMWGLMGAAAALFSTSLLGISANIGTDPLFIVLLLIYLILIDRYAAQKDRQSFVWLIILAGMAAILRYLGVTLILTGVILLLIIHKSSWKTGFVRAGIFGFFSSLPLVAWMIRNLTLTGTFFGPRYPSTWLFSENMRDAGIKISHWFIPYTLSSKAVFWMITGLILLLVLAGSRRTRFTALVRNIQKPGFLSGLLFTIIYLGAVLVLTKTEDHIALYDDRYYAPILMVLFLLLFRLIHDLVLPLFPVRFNYLAPWFMLLFFSIWLVYPVFSSYKLWAKTQKDEGIPYYNLYNLPRYRDSRVTHEMYAYLPNPQVPVYSNYPAAVYFFTRQLAESSPSKRGAADSIRDLQFYAGVWPARSPAILVWFEPNTKKNYFTPSSLTALTSLEPLYTSRDGGIYRLVGE